jgi:PAS domain S-box-containing protein
MSSARTEDLLAANRALRESEERFRSLTEISADFFWETDAAHRCTAIEFGSAYRGSRALSAKLGKTRWEILPASPGEAEWNAHRAEIAAHRRFVNFGFSRIEDGEERFYEESGEPRFAPQGEFLGYRGIGRDITERKRAEADLRASEARFRSLTALSSDWYWEQDENLRFTYLSSQAGDLGGYPVESSIGKTRWEIPDTTPLACTWAEHQAVLAARQAFRDFECSRVGPDGTLRYISMSGEPLLDEQGRFKGYHGTGRSITERKRIEEALRLSEERYALAMEVAEEGHWDWNVQTDELFASAQALKVLGIRQDAEYRTRAEALSHARFHPDDWPRISAQWRAALAGRGVEHEFEYRILRGEKPRWIRGRWKIFRDATGAALRVIGVVADITERKLAEDARRLSEERYALAMEATREGHWDWNIATNESYVSPRHVEIAGLPPEAKLASREEFLAQYPFHPEDRAKFEAARQAHYAGKTSRLDLELRILPRGDLRWVHMIAMCLRDAAGQPVRWAGSATDITDRKLAADALRASEARFRSLTALSSDWYWEQDENLRFTYLSAQANDLTGYSGESSIGKTRWELENMTPLSCAWAEHQAVLAARQPFRELECARVGADGVLRYISMSGAPIFDEQGEFRGYRGIGRNITARKQAEQALRESEARKSAMFETALDCIVSIDHEGRVVEFNPAAERTFGYRRAEALGEELAELIIPPRLRAQHRQGLARYLKSGEGQVLGKRTEMPAVRADGSEFPVELSVTRIATEGAPLFTAYLRDITERKRAEEALRQSEERFALAVAGANEGIFDWDLVTDRMYMSQRAQELFGLPPGELWRPRPEWRSLVTVHPDDARALRRVLSAHIAGEAPYDAEFRVCMPDGSVRWFRQRGIALRDAAGKAYRMVGSIGDVTEKHQAEEDLSRLERQLRLAQRLEAMGTLAGGIAHDFNNILGAILGFSEMAWRDAPKDSRLQRDLESIATAGERGRALVERILAFSRSGVGERVAVHVEQVVREALDLLSAKLPPAVTLRAELHAGRAAMLGDPTQVHQVLMNLGTNAVQAMPAGGTLLVTLDAMRGEAARAATIGKVVAGDYAVLRVADSGTGIAPEILERIFDPFFTTKELGTGTGLGLSLVHGIVAELGGAIDVATTLGKGSVFTVYLPRSGDALDSSQREELELPRGDGQRVLVVDDEEPLVQLATRTLEDLGYRPVGFTSSAAALAAFCAEPGRFDALIADERMPGLSGTALIREVRGVRRAIPILLMSGYVGGAVASLAREAGANDVLKKPLLARDLATSLARVLQQ